MTQLARKPARSSTITRTQLLTWAERVATFFAEHYGLPPITGRILGWLMICDPPEQSAGEIAEAIGASRASLTTNMRFLIGSGLVRRLTRPGGRTSYYRIDDGMWDAVIRRRIASMASFSRITLDGMNLVGANTPRASRLRAAHDFFEWMARLLTEASGPRGSG
jgi:DNA-binding transcriptional regulator GbsR (MarR family)